MTPTQWTALITADIPWQTKYADIGREVRSRLDNLTPSGRELTSKELVELLMPLHMCRGEQIEARNDLFKILFKLAKFNLAHNCHKGDTPVKVFGGKQLPWIWHASREPVKLCPHCGGVL